ncbi:polyprenyl synthetase family protein [Kitasatospora sp. LaBMicrA B282]|uniref:polyprenyl synthetase family protein n=1 Tax=Kitasatospora sp. LaBMicrA B282 TaxID=3420949 RepID=UPI003D143C60
MPRPFASRPDSVPGLDLDSFKHQIADIITEFFTTKTGPVLDVLMGAVAGGKLFRPVLCVVGWHAAWGPRSDEAALRLGASLELFHAYLLIHDDVFDNADTRRGRPALHRHLESRHPGAGTALAIAAGDVLACWHQELVSTAPLSPGQNFRVGPALDRMRREVVQGQYRELLLTQQGPAEDLSQVLAIARAKSGNYSVTWPLVIGATAATTDSAPANALRHFGTPLGEAFQLRDDLLGVFGDQAVTGKPVGDDLREGKPTALLALAWRQADSVQRRTLRAHVGRSDASEAEIVECQQIITDLGVPGRVEAMINGRYEQAMDALDQAPVTAPARTTLRHLAAQLAYRDT